MKEAPLEEIELQAAGVHVGDDVASLAHPDELAGDRRLAAQHDGGPIAG